VAIRRANPVDGNVSEAGFSLEIDLPILEALIQEVGDVRLAVIDPVSAYLGRVDSHRNAELRGLLAPLAALATYHSCYRVAINRTQSKPHQ